MGLLSGGGFQYYAGPDGLSSGVNSFADNFMKQLNSGREMKMKQSELDIMNLMRKAQMREIQAQAAQREDALQQQAAYRSDVANLPIQKNMTGLMASGAIDPKTQSSDPVALKQAAMGQLPGMTTPTMEDYLGLQMKHNPDEAIKNVVTVSGQKDKMNPLVAKLIESANNGTLNEQGKAILKASGYDFFNEKKEMKPGVEEEYDAKTHITRGRDYIQNVVTGEKTYTSDWRPIKGRESTANINISRDKSDRVFGANLRKEFNNLPDVKESNMILPKIKAMESAYAESQKTNNYVAVDQALITLYNKLTDPNSVVRESEYARTAENIPLLNAIKGKAQKVLAGGAGLTQSERTALMTMARLMKQGYGEIRGRRTNEYKSYANSAGLNADELFVDSFNDTPIKNGSGQRFVIKQVK
jgi:hypothetical protein